ncbi:GNAT family N-acetyltransferase [Nonomuraea sp. SBT364]|uniref:GNAT family N-acetyltransferase n=1 Tax=Nonomuraea sp. SBT364 TaxID=1580530 RepID=UPI00066D3B51|nr:GNAT family N-acetyltransferase [Nonomuraea sp. SBT364]
MDRDETLALFDRELRRGAQRDGPGSRVERIGDVIRLTGDAWNGIIWSDLDTSTADAAIEAQLRHFTELGRAFEWKLYAHDRPADLADRLLAAGLTPEPEETLMVARISDLPPAAVPDGIHLRPVTGPADAALLAAVHDQAFGTDSTRLMASLTTRIAEQPDRIFAVLAMAGDTPVSAARLELHPGTHFGSLWGGGTVEGWRGRGVYRSLVAQRAAIAADRGYDYLQVDASDDSRPILQRLGFHPLTTTTPYTWTP